MLIHGRDDVMQRFSIQIIFITLIALLLSACKERRGEQEKQPFAKENTVIHLKAGESTTIDEAGTTLTFLKIRGDSRCPKGAVCIQAGRVQALFQLQGKAVSGNTQQFELVLPATGGNSDQTVLGQHTIVLLEVAPYPEAGKPIPEREYRVTLAVK